MVGKLLKWLEDRELALMITGHYTEKLPIRLHWAAIISQLGESVIDPQTVAGIESSSRLQIGKQCPHIQVGCYYVIE